jgi:SAM-dependent methyltransferase
MNEQNLPLITPDCERLFKEYCNLTTKTEIENRLIEAQNKGLKTYPYRCIQEFRFSEPRIWKHPFYLKLLEAKESLGDKTFLDIGCCMGTDLRSLVIDNLFKPKNLYGVDIEETFINVGFDLFQDKNKFEATFFLGNFLKDSDPFQIQKHGQYDYVYCGSVFHLLSNFEETKILASRAYEAIKSGGVFFGRTTGVQNDYSEGNVGQLRFLHCAKSLKELLELVGFTSVSVTTSEVDGIPRSNISEHKNEALIMLSFVAFKQTQSKI